MNLISHSDRIHTVPTAMQWGLFFCALLALGLAACSDSAEVAEPIAETNVTTSVSPPSVAMASAPQRGATGPGVPDENIRARLVWATMVALDNANRTGNYSVLYALGSPQFKDANSLQSLADTFTPLRQSRIDVGRAIMMQPAYYIPPALLDDGRLRLRGGFDFRPNSLRFDILFRQVDGGWRIDALSVAEMSADSPRN